LHKIKALEKRSGEYDQTQLFIETPYRNDPFLADLIKSLSPNTLLSVACDLTLPTEWIKTAPAKEWKNIEVNLQKRPAIFLFHKELAI
jgi:16S rRNA (cytidine1402-2'-O)-methyltransferase